MIPRYPRKGFNFYNNNKKKIVAKEQNLKPYRSSRSSNQLRQRTTSAESLKLEKQSQNLKCAQLNKNTKKDVNFSRGLKNFQKRDKGWREIGEIEKKPSKTLKKERIKAKSKLERGE